MQLLQFGECFWAISAALNTLAFLASLHFVLKFIKVLISFRSFRGDGSRTSSWEALKCALVVS